MIATQHFLPASPEIRRTGRYIDLLQTRDPGLRNRRGTFPVGEFSTVHPIETRQAAPGHVAERTHSCVHRVYTRIVRTNIVIDDELLAEAQRLCGASTKRATVEFALQELVRRRERRKVLDLQGRVEWDGDLGKSRRSA